MSGITHRQALAALDTRELAALRTLSDAPAMRHLALHLGALLCTGTGITMTTNPWLLAPLLLAHGILLTFLFTAQHECIHGTAFRTPWLNVAVADAIGFVTVLPARWFRYFHLAHHRHTQDAAHDPELAAPKPRDWPGHLWALTGVARWWSMVVAMVKLAAGGTPETYVPPKAHAKVLREARVYLGAYVLLALVAVANSWTVLIWLWLIPILTGQPFLRAYLMAEHTACPLVPDMLLNSRTIFASPLINWLAWNMPNHTAHHAMPTVPFHRLPRLTALLRPVLRSTADGYVDVQRQIISSWSAERRKTVDGPEAEPKIASLQPQLPDSLRSSDSC